MTILIKELYRGPYFKGIASGRVLKEPWGQWIASGRVLEELGVRGLHRDVSLKS